MNHVDLDTIVLARGSHDRRDEGVCAMEAVAWLADEPHSDRPECTSPVLGAFMRRWNDNLDDEGRQRLKPYLPKLVGTRASNEVEEQRAWMAADWLVRVHTPAWLRLAGVNEAAEALEGLPELRDLDALNRARPAIDRARQDADAAGAAARDAARDAAGAAARDAAGAALAPTKQSLQQSAFELLDRMIAVQAPATTTT